jgi:predicted nucleotidyltransferase
MRTVRPVGSRAKGRATTRSDWDFLIDTDELQEFRSHLG